VTPSLDLRQLPGHPCPDPSMTCSSVTYSERCDFCCGSITPFWSLADYFRSSSEYGHRHGRSACLKSAKKRRCTLALISTGPATEACMVEGKISRMYTFRASPFCNAVHIPAPGGAVFVLTWIKPLRSVTSFEEEECQTSRYLSMLAERVRDADVGQSNRPYRSRHSRSIHQLPQRRRPGLEKPALDQAGGVRALGTEHTDGIAVKGI